MHKFKKYSLMFLIGFYCFSTACGGGSSASDHYFSDSSMEMSGESSSVTNGSYIGSYTENLADSNYETSENQTDTSNLPVEKQDKLVYTANIDIETKNYADTYATVKNLIHSYDGIIQNESVWDNDYGWYENDNVPTASMRADFTCRIPSNKYNDFINEFSGLDENNKITNLSSTVENINQEYYDTKNREQALQTQYDRLLEMLAQSQSVSEMLEIEDRLSNVDYQLNSIRNRLLIMDTDVAYSTVRISIDEVTIWSRAKEDNFFSKLGNIFEEAVDYGKELLEELIYVILMFIPTLLFIIIPGLFLLKLILAIVRKVFKFDIKNVLKKKSKKE